MEEKIGETESHTIWAVNVKKRDDGTKKADYICYRPKRLPSKN